MLKFGSRGEAVTILQSRLTAAGHAVEADGDFGAKTEAAVEAFQRAAGLVIDGIAGAKTMAALQKKDTSKLLKESDIADAAALLDVDTATIKAVNRVESAGSGYLPDGRPRILFERHIFYRELAAAKGKAAAQQAAARRPDICNRKAGGYVGGAAEYARLAGAKSIDTECALKAASWGLFQILGCNFKAAGFASVFDFVEAVQRSEGAQLQAFAHFVSVDKAMHTALKKQDWAAFAAKYNGPAYKKNNYDDKLKNAYAFYKSKTPDAAAA